MGLMGVSCVSWELNGYNGNFMGSMGIEWDYIEILQKKNCFIPLGSQVG